MNYESSFHTETPVWQPYKDKEKETREQLEKNVNEIFKNIYNGGFSLSIDEKYKTKKVTVDGTDNYNGVVSSGFANNGVICREL